MKEKFFKFFLLCVGLCVIATIPCKMVFSAMTSGNFKVTSDVFGNAGGPSSSDNYKGNDTLGETVTGIGSSTNYKNKAGFWHTMPQGTQLGLDCESSDVYMVDYTLGTADNYNKYLFSSTQECVVTDNSSAPWGLTIRSSDLSSSSNNLANSNVYLMTDESVDSGDTITNPTTNISEPAGPEYTLNADRTIITGNDNASGVYYNRPTVKLTNLNNFYNESLTGTITLTIQ